MKILNKAGIEITDNLDFGIVEAGLSKDYEYILWNDTEAQIIDLEISLDNSEVEIGEYQKDMLPNSQMTVKFKWSPSVKVKKGLNVTLKINGSELYRN